MKKTKQIDVSYESLTTHDVANSINNITGQSACKWLVMEWDGRESSGIFVGNPIGWLLRNVNSSLALFKDNGIRSFSKVLIAIRPGRRNKRFIDVADKICRHFGASLTLLNIVSETGDCVSASMPMAFVTAVQDGRIKRGDLLYFIGTGAGLSMACTLLSY